MPSPAASLVGAMLVFGVVGLAPAAAQDRPTPVVGVFPVTYLSQHQATGHVVSEAVPVPPAAIGFNYKLMGDPVGDPASASWSLELSCDGGLTWPCGTAGGGGGALGTRFGSGTSDGELPDLNAGLLPTHARFVLDVTGTAILTVTGEFFAPIGVDITPIPVGAASPWGVALNPTTKLLYVVDEGGSHDVSVIDTTSNAIVAHIPLDVTQNHFGAAVNAVTNRIYVAGTDSVEVIDGNTNSRIESVVVGPHGGPNAVAVNPRTNRIYATNLASGTLTVVDGVTHGILARLSVGRDPSSVAVNPETNRIYVAASEAGDPITVVDGETNSIIATIPTGLPSRGMAVNPNTDTLYVSTFSGRSVLVIDGRTNQIITATPLGGPIENVAVDSGRNRIYAAGSALVTHSAQQHVYIIDGETHHVISVIPIKGCCPRSGGIDVRAETKRVYAGGGIVTSFRDDFVGRAHLPDLTLSASALPDPVVLGTDFEVTFTLTNATRDDAEDDPRPKAATDVTAFLRLFGAQFTSVAPSDATCEPFFSTSVLRCTVPELWKHQGVFMRVTVRPERSGLMIISGLVSADQVDIETSNNDVVGAITVKTQ